MKAVFVETRSFMQRLQSYLSDSDYQELQAELMQQPDAGRVIRGTGGIRKVRWRDAHRGKGKRGGIRAIYLHLPELERAHA